KMQLLDGSPTARLDLNHRFDVAEKLRELNEQALEMIKRAKARVVDEETGVDGKNTEQKALTSGEHEQRSKTENGSGSSVNEVPASQGADESATLNREQI